MGKQIILTVGAMILLLFGFVAAGALADVIVSWIVLWWTRNGCCY